MKPLKFRIFSAESNSKDFRTRVQPSSNVTTSKLFVSLMELRYSIAYAISLAYSRIKY